MNYWINVQWPCEEGKGFYVPFIWVKKDLAEKAGDMKIGDIVLIYQTKNGPSGGNQHQYKEGKQGIIVISSVESLFNKREEEVFFGIPWIKVAKLKTIYDSGFIPRIKVNKILGYKEGFYFRGFGDKGSGIKLINENIYNLLKKNY